MKVEPNKKPPVTDRVSVTAPRLMCADGSWWTIDARDPDLEDYLKTASARPPRECEKSGSIRLV